MNQVSATAAPELQAYLSIDQSATYSSLSRGAIRKFLDSGKLTTFRPVPGRVLISRAELDALIQASANAPSCQPNARREAP